MDKELKIAYKQYDSESQMCDVDGELVRRAVSATSMSYAPYSGFNVGAAVRMSDGRIFDAANQENAAYPSGLCAERTAMFYAHAHSKGAYIESIAIAACCKGVRTADPVSPCAACRQVMLEFECTAHPMSVIMVGANRILKFESAHDLVPFSFDSF